MSPQLFRVLPFALFVLLSVPATAQGSDDCATATALPGVGSFSFDNASATTSPQGQSFAVCNFFSSTAMQRDVWFTWTAPSTDHYSFYTCGQTSVDTKIAVYDGAGCPAVAPIACNDDSCNSFQSRVDFDGIAGSSYTLQLGVFPGAAGGSGNFTIEVTVPPPPCGTNTGPDIIVGEITDVMNVTSSGGIDAIALGTDGCNIGTQLANWIAGGLNHPVIRQNLYSYKVVGGAGHFEMKGLSWLKHASSALQGSTCCTCQSGGDSSHLGVGCSDPYGSGLNGGQTNAGPNWQVNAHTGVYVTPPANPPWSGAIARRCQVPVAELEVTGGVGAAKFFGECHYVARDHALAGNQNNNVSWRAMTCTQAGGEFSLQLAGQTVRTDPAIRAWPTVEPGVALTDLQIPGDGLLILGAKATDLGGGEWHYEYAVFNMNADRNVGSFSLPVQPGVSVTNIGFHDISYHDGDGNGSATFSGADWVGAVFGGAITWACETQAVNDNANAIRWGSLYNFRFDADAAPTSGVITIGLWKPGTPNAMTASGEVPGNAPFSAFCLGDGTSGTPCPCANDGASGHGCASSAFAGGALLTGSGVASVANDSAALAANDVTGNAVVFFQGDAQLAPAVVDDGLGCVGGSVVRLGTKPVGGAASVYPDLGDASISVRGAVPPAGATRYYQAFYRNSVSAFCPPATSNRTNGVAITWSP